MRTEGSELSFYRSPGQGVREDPGEAGQGCYLLLVHSPYKTLRTPESVQLQGGPVSMRGYSNSIHYCRGLDNL